MKLYQKIASTLEAYKNCVKSGNQEWQNKHEDCLENIEKKFLPSGSGFDNGTKIDYDKSTLQKLVFVTSYHFMNENGFYDGWLDYVVVVTPLFNNFYIRVIGKNRNDIKSYINDTFYHYLTKDLPNE